MDKCCCLVQTVLELAHDLSIYWTPADRVERHVRRYCQLQNLHSMCWYSVSNVWRRWHHAPFCTCLTLPLFYTVPDCPPSRLTSNASRPPMNLSCNLNTLDWDTHIICWYVYLAQMYFKPNKWHLQKRSFEFREENHCITTFYEYIVKMSKTIFSLLSYKINARFLHVIPHLWLTLIMLSCKQN
jgi:hypothetical protein